jgi:hypothetical protein
VSGITGISRKLLMTRGRNSIRKAASRWRNVRALNALVLSTTETSSSRRILEQNNRSYGARKVLSWHKKYWLFLFL